jgi:hypothetical protein
MYSKNFHAPFRRNVLAALIFRLSSLEILDVHQVRWRIFATGATAASKDKKIRSKIHAKIL